MYRSTILLSARALTLVPSSQFMGGVCSRRNLMHCFSCSLVRGLLGTSSTLLMVGFSVILDSLP